MSRPPRFLAIVGATTSGKTALSLATARALGGEIVSMDSRQVYRGMDVGTDKVGLPERATVRHHGLDLRDPGERYSAGQFGRDARRWITAIEARGRVPILAGGTGFFLRALTDPLFREPPMDRERLEPLRAWLGRQPRERLATWTRRLDPQRAPTAVPGGPQRMCRTLEVALLTGRPLSWWHRHAEPLVPPVPAVVVQLQVPREELDRRIDARTHRMMAAGLLDEVRRLVEAGYGPRDPGMSGTGYRELAAYLAGAMTLDDALESMRLQTRRYARRQETWFRYQLSEPPVFVDGMMPLEGQVERVVEAWQSARHEAERTDR